MEQLKELIRVNLLFANPQVTEKGRAKGKQGHALVRSILSQYLLSTIIFSVIYGAIMFSTDFSKRPELFTYFVGLFGLLGLSQTISAILNVFLESRDIPAYLPLPFKQWTIFIAKLIVVSLAVVPFLLPIFILFLLSSISAGMPVVFAVCIGICLFICCLLILYFLSSILVFGLAKTSFYKKHKKIVTSALLLITTGLVVVGILFFNRSSSLDEVSQTPKIALFMPLFYITTQFTSTASLMSISIMVVLILVLSLILRFFILPHFYEELIEISTIEGNPTRKIKPAQSVTKL